MKKLFPILLSVACVFGATAQTERISRSIGQERQALPGGGAEARLENKQCILRGDSLSIAFDLVIRGEILSPTEALHIIPVYRAGEREWLFPAMLINGKRRATYYRREQALLSHDAYWRERPHLLATLTDNSPKRLRYRLARKLPAGAPKTGSLRLEQYVADCCDLVFIAAEPLAMKSDSQSPTPTPTPTPARRPIYESNVSFIRPSREAVKERKERLTLRINYIVDRYDVLPQYGHNAEELQKADKILAPLSSRRETYQIKYASIKGYASPEAPYEYNLKLSQRRADGFRRYLIDRYGLYHLSAFPATGLGEDWEGLRQAVGESYMPYRDRVLAIIDGVGIFNGREKMLMDLAGGEPYKYMLQNFYPALRRMEMEVAYTVRSFETMEAEAIIDDRPQDLSQEEIYDVARRRNKERVAEDSPQDYGREYDVAARYFPTDATANINAASAALVRGDLDGAWRYLSKVQSLPEAYNNLGVYYWMRGDVERAEHYLRKALDVKGEEARARYNLRLLRETSGASAGK